MRTKARLWKDQPRSFVAQHLQNPAVNNVLSSCCNYFIRERIKGSYIVTFLLSTTILVHHNIRLPVEIMRARSLWSNLRQTYLLVIFRVTFCNGLQTFFFTVFYIRFFHSPFFLMQIFIFVIGGLNLPQQRSVGFPPRDFAFFLAQRMSLAGYVF